jgi:hypothetical protein
MSLSTVFAVCGADGSGKTTWIQKRYKPEKVIHALPKMRVFSVVDKKWKRLVTEVLMGIERVTQSWKAKIGNYDVMDRCYICGEVYALFWADRFEEPINYKICALLNKFAWKPDEILFFAPFYGKAKPRKKYTEEDIAVLTSLYEVILQKYGYDKIGMNTYDFGVQFVCKRRTTSWNQDLNFLSIRGRKISLFS